jgi:hypothetical protein
MNGRKLFAIAVATGVLSAAGDAGAQAWAGALEGLGQGIQDMSALVETEMQRQLMLKQHELEMQRIEREYQLRREDRQREIESRRVLQVQQARAQVETAHPGWVSTVRSQDFRIWLALQPDSVKQLASTQQAQAAITVLDLFKRDQERLRQ